MATKQFKSYHQAGDDDDEDGEEEDDGVETLWAPDVVPLLALQLALQHVLLQERVYTYLF